MQNISNPRDFLKKLYDCAVEAAQPHLCVPRYMPKPPKSGRVFVIGAGKASAQMASVFEKAWEHHDTHSLSGIVITRYGYANPCEHIEIIEASHPVPDQAGLDATKKLLSFLEEVSLTEDDLVVCLISGGGSALMVKPICGMELDDKQAVNEALLKSGAPIQDMNIVRKAMSQIKGGGLARVCTPAKLHTLVISDVAGDDLESIASAPTIASNLKRQDALNVIERYNVNVPKVFLDHLMRDPSCKLQDSAGQETPQDIYIISSAKISLEAAATYASSALDNLQVTIISDALEGDSRACAEMHMALLKDMQAPCLLLSGGETTVHVTGQGRGGNNGQFALESLSLMPEDIKLYGLAADTDGIDGSEDNAGAFFDADILKQAQDQSLDLHAYVQNNDSYGFFEATNGLLVTGPTYTNVNDFRALLYLGD